VEVREEISPGRRPVRHYWLRVVISAAVTLSVLLFTWIYARSMKEQTNVSPARPPVSRPATMAGIARVKDFKPIEQEPLYQALSKVRALNDDEINRDAAPFGYDAVMADPASWRLAPVAVRAELYQAVRLRLPGVPGGDADVVKAELADREGRIITLISFAWPKNLSRGDEIVANGVFYKVRSYDDTRGREQFAPLILAKSMARGVKSGQSLGSLITVVIPLLLTVAVLAVAIYRFSVRRKKEIRIDIQRDEDQG